MIAPEAVASWPPAPGWYLVFALVFIALAILVFASVRKWRRNLYRREALQQLEKIGPGNLGTLNSLLKTVAMSRYSRERAASLSGTGWLEFLGETCRGVDFKETPGNLLASAAYMNAEQEAVTEDQWKQLTSHASIWIRKHH